MYTDNLSYDPDMKYKGFQLVRPLPSGQARGKKTARQSAGMPTYKLRLNTGANSNLSILRGVFLVDFLQVAGEEQGQRNVNSTFLFQSGEWPTESLPTL